MTTRTQTDSSAGQRYLLLADVSGYTAFMSSVEQAHGEDFSGGIPAGYAVLGELLDTVVDGVQPDFQIAKLEGDAVFADASADDLDGKGDRVLSRLRLAYDTFRTRRGEARRARDHVCTACPVVSTLDLKMILHRGLVVHQTVGPRTELLGPAVNVAHRLLKNTVGAVIGYRAYLFLTDEAANGLGLSGIGISHREQYADVGSVLGRIVELAENPGTTQGAR
jgi:class 3 adenylate cyclase